MRTAFDFDHSELDEAERSFLTGLKNQGWFGTHVAADEERLGFSYTTGFQLRFGFPEVIVCSLASETAQAIFETMFEFLCVHRTYDVTGPIPEILEGLPVRLTRVSPDYTGGLLTWTSWFYRGDDFEALHLIWPDAMGRFPEETGFDESLVGLQPNLSGG